MIQILIVNTAVYIYGNIRLKEISILTSLEQIQANTISDLAFSAQLGRGFHTRPKIINFSDILRDSHVFLTLKYQVYKYKVKHLSVNL